MSLIKNFLIIIILLSSFGLVFAQNEEYTLEDILWNGYINIYLDKEEFDLGEEVTGYLTMENSEYYPLIGQRIILQVSTQKNYYPSHLSNSNIILENVFEDQWILPRTIKRFEFSLGKLPAGNYYANAYSWVLKSMFVGSNAILFNPVSKNFTVKGEENPQIFIERSTTNFGENKIVGPLGFLIQEGQEFPGEIFITNSTNQTKNNLKLIIELCDWSSAFCEGDLFESENKKILKEINVPQLQPNQTIKIETTMIAPQIPSAYEINMKLKENEKIHSIYKNRLIVEGGTAKLRKILFDGLADRNYILQILIAGSPDHFTYPDFDNFNLKMTIYNNNIILNEQETSFDKIKTGQVKSHIFEIEEKIFDRICVEVNKDQVVYDKDCFTIDIELLQKEYDQANPEEMQITHNYNSNTKQLTLTLAKQKQNLINARIQILTENNVRIKNQTVNTTTPYNQVFDLERNNYTLIIDDYDSQTQKIIYLHLNEETPFAFDETMNACPGVVCPSSMVCSIQTFESSDGSCCLGDCITDLTRQGTLGINTIPLIFWIALIFLITAIAILLNVFIIKGRRKK